MMNLKDEICHALFEAKQMHIGEDGETIILTAMKLSGAPYDFVKEVFNEMENKNV